MLLDARSAATDYLAAIDDVKDIRTQRPPLLMSQAGLFERSVERSGLARPHTTGCSTSTQDLGSVRRTATADSARRPQHRQGTKGRRPLTKPASEPALRSNNVQIKAVGQMVVSGVTMSALSQISDEASRRKAAAAAAPSLDVAQVRAARLTPPPTTVTAATRTTHPSLLGPSPSRLD